jgi:HPt (histidine-containing phosphotransfer) domain-containing protein
MIGDAEHPEESRLDYSDLLARMENDQDLVCDLVQIFKKEFPRELRTLREAVTAGDMMKVETVGHALKGMMAMLAFRRAAQAARRIEVMGKQRTPECLPEMLAGLEDEATLALAELESLCVGPPP